MHACGCSGVAALNGAQKVGAQSITGCFRTAATAIAESEASIRPVQERHSDKAMRLWISLRSLAETSPLSRLALRLRRNFASPLEKIAAAHKDVATGGVESIAPYVVSPWDERLPIVSPTSGITVMEGARERLALVLRS